MLQPADRLEDFPEAVQVVNGLTGQPAWALPHKAGSDECIHLTATGCAIHDRLPVVCSAFDCRAMYLMHGRAERRRRERLMPGAKALYDRGRELAVQEGLA